MAPQNTPQYRAWLLKILKMLLNTAHGASKYSKYSSTPRMPLPQETLSALSSPPCSPNSPLLFPPSIHLSLSISRDPLEGANYRSHHNTHAAAPADSPSSLHPAFPDTLPLVPRPPSLSLALSPSPGTLWKERTIGAIITRMPLRLQTDGNGTETGPREPFSIGTPTDSGSSSSSNGASSNQASSKASQAAAAAVAAAAVTASPLLFPSTPLPPHPFPWLVPLNNCPNYCSGRGLCDATYWECRYDAAGGTRQVGCT
ncbi:unnamed protein product, partial [Closterium sp. NIES-54]